MIIEFDFDPKWITTAGDLIDIERRYFAAAPPYFVVLVIHAEVAQTIEDLPLTLKGARFDCSIGYHIPAESTSGFTLPQYDGYNHTKITIRREVNNIPADDTLTGIFQGAPRMGDKYIGEWRPGKSAEMTFNLPPILASAAGKLASKLGMDLNALVWETLLNRIEDGY